MIRNLKPLLLLRRLRRDQGGATFVVAALATMMIVGFGAITVDLGNAYRVRRQLQSSSDAAALAGAMSLYQGNTYTTAESTAKTWSAGSGDKNVITGVSTTPTATTVSCTGPTGASCSSNTSSPNGMMVTQAATVPTYFGRLLGIDNVAVSTSSYAIGNTSSSTCSGCGGLSEQADVMVLIDTTQSMADCAGTSSSGSCTGKTDASDTACDGLTNVGCAILGVRSLLTDLTAPSNGSGGATVGLMTFPGLKSAADAAEEYCSGGTPSSSNIAAYDATTTSPYYSTTSGSGPYYLIYPTYSSLSAGGGFDGSYKGSSGSLKTTDDLVLAAAGNTSSCAGLTAYGGAGTSLAIAMQEATAILKNDSRTGSSKYLVILSDGDANTSAAMPSSFSITDPVTNDKYTAGNDECHQAIAASRIAQADGITVVTLGYGEETTNANGSPAGCDSDTGSTDLITPCTTMTDMASIGTGSSTSPQFFYSDATGSGTNACPSGANPSFTSVNAMFESLANVIIGGSGATAGSQGGLPHLIPAS
jgi:Flp pilus assembly protein TadG